MTQRADDSEPVEGTPNLELSEAVFPEGAEPVAEAEALDETAGEEAPAEPAAEVEEAPAEPAAEEEAPAEPAEEEPSAQEPAEEEPSAQEPAAEELLDESIEADAVAPDEPGPGDSEGEPPAAPE